MTTKKRTADTGRQKDKAMAEKKQTATEIEDAAVEALCLAAKESDMQNMVQLANQRKSWKYRAKRTTCPKGHSMQNALVTPEGGRVCRQCNHEARGATT